jgi:hypothetical protein
MAIALITLAAPPVAAQVVPVATIAPDPRQDLDPRPELIPEPRPFETTPEGCIVPAAASLEPGCPSSRSPGETRGSACTMPAVYLGGQPGPCPERKGPPQSRIVPLVPAGVIR